jgi:hypothetical protein
MLSSTNKHSDLTGLTDMTDLTDITAGKHQLTAPGHFGKNYKVFFHSIKFIWENL